MFLYKDQKLHSHGICFSIPDNFYLFSAEDTDVAIEIEAADHSYTVVFGISEHCSGTSQELQSMISDRGGMKPLSTISPVTLDGFSGHALKYRSTREEYFEIRLSLGRDTEFYLYITALRCGIDAVLASKEIKWIFDQIKRSTV